MTTHEFEIRDELTLAATPEQVWDAIATGPGIDSWFMGHTEIEPGKGGTNRLAMPDTPRSRRSLSVNEITEGAHVRLNVPGLPDTTGTIDSLRAPHVVGDHTPNGILLLLKGYRDTLVVEYHGFSDDENAKATETAYQSWLTTAFA
jgi:hypothetical protein